MSNLVIAFNKNWGPLIPDDDNREIVEKTFIAFGKETEKIQKKILIYFSSGSSKFGWFNREGTTKFRGSPDSKRFFESLKHRPNSITQEELDLFKETDYLI
ncbi:MAG: hypothetical protein KAX11_10170, partial [Candidatus Aminicenantes bacterium]|nr:hypothetical protein [Candidatus Aminicenantes bacterium]